MLSKPKQRDRTSLVTVNIPEFNVNLLPKIRNEIDSDPKNKSESLSSVSSGANSMSRENTFMSFNHSFLSDPATKTKTFNTPQQDKDVQEFLMSILGPSQYHASLTSSEYDARFSVAVIGSDRSGKEVILSKELGLRANIPVLDKNIQIMASG